MTHVLHQNRIDKQANSKRKASRGICQKLGNYASSHASKSKQSLIHCPQIIRQSGLQGKRQTGRNEGMHVAREAGSQIYKSLERKNWSLHHGNCVLVLQYFKLIHSKIVLLQVVFETEEPRVVCNYCTFNRPSVSGYQFSRKTR